MEENKDSILNSVKKLLGLDPSVKDFDLDIMMNINAAMSTLWQIGVGPEEGFMITSENETFEEYLGPDSKETNQIKMYLFYKTRLGFDPPSSSSVMECIKEMIREAEWRLNAQVDPRSTFE